MNDDVQTLAERYDGYTVFRAALRCGLAHVDAQALCLAVEHRRNGTYPSSSGQQCAIAQAEELAAKVIKELERRL
jgi:hypothetical protein